MFGHVYTEHVSRRPRPKSRHTTGRSPPLSPTPRLEPRDRAELRSVDDQMMAVHIRGNGAAISRCFWLGPLVARERSGSARLTCLRDFRDSYRLLDHLSSNGFD